MMKKQICITCPMSCQLQIQLDEGGQIVQISGNRCPRGEVYAKKELTAPERMITSTVRIQGALHPLLPIVSEKAIPKEKIFDVMDAIRKVTVKAPIFVGDIILSNVCQTGVNILASKTMEQTGQHMQTNRKENDR